MAEFSLSCYDPEQGRLVIGCPGFDFERFAETADKLVALLSASVVEKQLDADLVSWLIDFEGCQLLLKGEHYSESLWLESLSTEACREELDYLAGLLQRGIS